MSLDEILEQARQVNDSIDSACQELDDAIATNNLDDRFNRARELLKA